jgi:hypothetical protein
MIEYMTAAIDALTIIAWSPTVAITRWVGSFSRLDIFEMRLFDMRQANAMPPFQSDPIP